MKRSAQRNWCTRGPFTATTVLVKDLLIEKLAVSGCCCTCVDREELVALLQHRRDLAHERVPGREAILNRPALCRVRDAADAVIAGEVQAGTDSIGREAHEVWFHVLLARAASIGAVTWLDRKSTRLNSSH